MLCSREDVQPLEGNEQQTAWATEADRKHSAGSGSQKHSAKADDTNVR